MAFGDFDLKTVVQRFGLCTDEQSNLFRDVPPVAPTESLSRWLAVFA